MIIRVKYFRESQNIIVMLPPGREFFCAKCAQFPLKLNDDIFPLGQLLFIFEIDLVQKLISKVI